jgi:peptidylprolyl isomerase
MGKRWFRCDFRVTFRSFAWLLAAGLLAAAAPIPKVLAPSEIVAAAPAADWVAIAPSDLLVMDLAPDRDGNKRRVVIQLMPPPFSQGWVGNIRKLAAAHWWDGLSINRVQDNYVVQWGDADGEDKAKAKKLPSGLVTVQESEYSVNSTLTDAHCYQRRCNRWEAPRIEYNWRSDSYAQGSGFSGGWAVAGRRPSRAETRLLGKPKEGFGVLAESWPVHCYGMVGVGRNLSPDTGTGAELYTVIGHAPRHLDRNIALVGRVIMGIEHLSSLPRGTGALGFYEKPEQRVTITSIRLGNEVAELPRYQYLSTESASFAKYADARANRRDAFFIVPAGGADICNIPVPVRKAP